MAPERIAKRFRRMYARCEREATRFASTSETANAMLNKAVTIWDRWELLAKDSSYCQELLAVAGFKSKVLAKQAAVLKATVATLEASLLDLNESVHKLQQMAKEGEAFVRSEYRGNKTNDQHEDRTLTISAAEFASGLASIHKMYQRTSKVKQAAYDLISEGSDASERDQLCALFVSPPCFDSKCIQDLLAKGLA